MSASCGPFPDLRVRSPRAGEGRLRRAVAFWRLGLAAGVLALGSGLAPEGLRAADATMPSGQIVTFHDAHVEDQGDGTRWLVLRYLAPSIGTSGDSLGYDTVSGDLDALCAVDGLAAAEAAGDIAQIVIVLMDRPVERGTADPEATQFIGAYASGPEGCVWQ